MPLSPEESEKASKAINNIIEYLRFKGHSLGDLARTMAISETPFPWHETESTGRGGH